MAEAISGLTGTLQGTVSNLANTAQSWLDKIIPPETREKVLAWISKFMAEKPQLFSFLASHIALSGPVIGLFITVTIALAIFALLVAIILALLFVVLFIVTMAGFSLVFLFPALLVTTFVATFLWLWGMAVYYILKYFNQTDIPGIHSSLGEGLGGEAKDYAEKGRDQGYGIEFGNLGDSGRKRLEEGKRDREDVMKGDDRGEKEEAKVKKSSGHDAKKQSSGGSGAGAADQVKHRGEQAKGKGDQIRKKGGEGVGKAADGVNGVAGKTPAGGATKGVTDGLKGLTGS